MKLNVEILRRLDLPAEALDKEWSKTYTHGSMAEYEADIDRVVEAYLTTGMRSFGGVALPEILRRHGAVRVWEEVEP